MSGDTLSMSVCNGNYTGREYIVKQCIERVTLGGSKSGQTTLGRVTVRGTTLARPTLAGIALAGTALAEKEKERLRSEA